MSIARMREPHSEEEPYRAFRGPSALRAGGRSLSRKWHHVPPSVIPLDIADMDFGLDPVVASALQRAVRSPLVYPPSYVDNGAAATLSSFYESRYGLSVAVMN